jgi:hypothetical protein
MQPHTLRACRCARLLRPQPRVAREVLALSSHCGARSRGFRRPSDITRNYAQASCLWRRGARRPAARKPRARVIRAMSNGRRCLPAPAVVPRSRRGVSLASCTRCARLRAIHGLLASLLRVAVARGVGVAAPARLSPRAPCSPSLRMWPLNRCAVRADHWHSVRPRWRARARKPRSFRFSCSLLSSQGSAVLAASMPGPLARVAARALTRLRAALVDPRQQRSTPDRGHIRSLVNGCSIPALRAGQAGA